MGGEWKPIRLGDEISLRGGLSYKGKYVDKGSALLVGMGCVSFTERFLEKGVRRYGGPFSDSHSVRPGDLVIATRQQSDNLPILGFPAMIPEVFEGHDVVVATNMYKVENDSELSNRFLYWLLRSAEYRKRILSSSKGTTVRMITKDAIEDFEFRCPPDEERSAIVRILDTLDDKIELNRKMNETLEAMARALFKSWFVDFDPVRAKAEGRQPEGMDAETAKLFPDSFEESELGMIPKGWKLGALNDVARFQSGYTFKSKDWQEFGVPVVKIGSVKPGVVDLQQVSYVSEEVAEQADRYRLDVGDLLVGMTGHVGEVGLIPPTDVLPLLNQRVGKFVLEQSGIAELGFVYCIVRNPDFKVHVETHAHGSVQANVSGKDIMSYPFALPPVETKARFNYLISAKLEGILLSLAEMKTTAMTRDALLPKLLSGQIRIRDAEKFVEDAA